MKCVPQAGIDQAAFIIGYQLLCGITGRVESTDRSQLQER
jgi:hypothetical protein